MGSRLMTDPRVERHKLTPTEIEGLMSGGYCEGAEIQLNSRYRLECVDGRVWTLTTNDEESIGSLNPTNAVLCDEIRKGVQQLLKRAENYRTYESFVESEFC